LGIKGKPIKLVLGNWQTWLFLSDCHNPEGATMVLRNQKCKVFDDVVVPQEAVKSVNDVYRLFGIHCPTLIAMCRENSGGN